MHWFPFGKYTTLQFIVQAKQKWGGRNSTAPFSTLYSLLTALYNFANLLTTLAGVAGRSITPP